MLISKGLLGQNDKAVLKIIASVAKISNDSLLNLSLVYDGSECVN